MMNYKKYYKKWLSVLIVSVFLAGLAAGCTVRETKEKTDRQEEVAIPMILTVDPSSGNKNEQKVVEEFNKAYEGIYRMDVEWVMETEEEYRQSLKRQNVTDSLPAVITDIRMLPSFYQMMIADGRLEDLSPYINEDKEWKEIIEQVVLDGCSEPDGSIYLSPLSTAAFSCSGVFFNKDLFAQAGIESFPGTWEEFWSVCEQLSNAGITPLALHTEGTAWAPMLFATTALADTEAGAAFMAELYPKSYQNESGLHMAQTLKRLFAYTTQDAVYADFDVAFDDFFSGKAAMIPNGYWMLDQIPKEWQGKVSFAPFPGNKLVSSPETFGWSVVSSYSDEIKKGAVEFLKFRTKMNWQEKEDVFSKDAQELDPIVQEYMRAYQSNPQFVPNYQVKWNSILQEETLGEYLPELISGKITPEQFTQMEDESIRQSEEEQ